MVGLPPCRGLEAHGCVGKRTTARSGDASWFRRIGPRRADSLNRKPLLQCDHCRPFAALTNSLDGSISGQRRQRRSFRTFRWHDMKYGLSTVSIGAALSFVFTPCYGGRLRFGLVGIELGGFFFAPKNASAGSAAKVTTMAPPATAAARLLMRLGAAACF